MASITELGHHGYVPEDILPGFPVFPDRIIPAASDLDRIFGAEGCLKKAENFFRQGGYLPEGEKVQIVENPIPHEYEKNGKKIISSAIYYMQFRVGNNVLMLSAVPADKNATEHFHKSPFVKITEHYKLIAGSAHLMLEDETIKLDGDNDSHTVVENTVHRFTTKLSGSPALTALVMENVAGLPDNEWHTLTDNN